MKSLIVLIALLLTACAAQQAHDRQSAKVHTELGAGYFQRDQTSIALDEFTEATKIDPDYALAYNGLGLVYAKLGEDAKADANFKKSIQLEPGNPESRNNYGAFLCSRGRIDESIVQFNAAVKDPLYATPELAYTNAGICSLKKKDEKNAEAYFVKALQFQPLMHQAAYQLALIQFNRGEYEQARKSLVNALVSNPSAETLWLGVKIERRLKDKDAESSYALQLRRKYPDSEQTKALLSGQ
jgi:type IV pilus assembly protein PilF